MRSTKLPPNDYPLFAHYFDPFRMSNRISPCRVIHADNGFSRVTVQVEDPVRKRIVVPDEYVRVSPVPSLIGR